MINAFGRKNKTSPSSGPRTSLQQLLALFHNNITESDLKLVADPLAS
jgi:hypothetical protein